MIPFSSEIFHIHIIHFSHTEHIFRKSSIMEYSPAMEMKVRERLNKELFQRNVDARKESNSESFESDDIPLTKNLTDGIWDVECFL